MKRFFLFFSIIFVNVLAFAQGFTVNNYTADIFLNSEGYFDVVEKYDINFTEAKHGIFRDIITKVDFKDENGKVSKREIYISNIDIPGQTFKTNEFLGKLYSNKLNIRIGDKNTLVNGNQQYEIHYRVKNALIFTQDKVQLYWNIKPSEWFSIFNKINFTIHTPEGAILSPENCFVYSGNTGDTTPSKVFNYNYSGNVFSGISKKNFFSVPGQNVTLLVKLPKSLIQEVNFTPPFWKRYKWLGYVGIVFLMLFTFIKIRLNSNKVIAVTSYYPPQKIDPAMAGILIDNTTDFRDIICLLPYWATKGIIKMEEVINGERSLNIDLKLTKLRDLSQDAPDYESNLFNKIFSGKDVVMTSSLRSVVAEALSLLTKSSKQYYSKQFSKLKIIILILSWLWAFFSISFLPFLLRNYVNIDSSQFIFFLIFNFLFFFIIFPFGIAAVINLLRSKNQQGKSIMPELLGFYQFIKMAEVERIKELLKEDPYYFEKTMPYAVAFNLLKEWSSKFEGLIINAPDWYRSSTGTGFKFNVFASSFSNSISYAKTPMVTSSSSSSSSSSRSSGGGSSGGGFGGGGGGSW